MSNSMIILQVKCQTASYVQVLCENRWHNSHIKGGTHACTSSKAAAGCMQP
jgi:hypothetical protein